MRILWVYLLKQFLKPLIYGLILFLTLISVVHLLEKLEVISNHKAAWRDVLTYLVLLMPSWLVKIAPVSMILACFFSLGKMSENSEFTAVQAGGVSLKLILLPVLILGMLITGIVFLAQDLIVPSATQKARAMYLLKIKQYNANPQSYWENLLVSGSEGRIFTAKALDAQAGTMQRPIITRFEGDEIREQVDALKAVWSGNGWIFYQGALRTYKNSEVFEQQFQELALALPESPRDLTPEEQPNPDSLSTKKMHSLISKFRRLGLAHQKLAVAVQVKYAYPVSNLVVLILTIPFALKLKKMGRMRSFAYTIIIAFSYWTFLSIGQVFGESGLFTPWLAAWFANLIYLTAGMAYFWKI